MKGDKQGGEMPFLLIEQIQDSGWYIEDNKEVGLLMLIERARVEHKHELEYATCGAEHHLAGLGSGLWFWDDLHGDDTVGFFLQAKTTADTFSFSPSITTFDVSTFQKQA